MRTVSSLVQSVKKLSLRHLETLCAVEALLIGHKEVQPINPPPSHCTTRHLGTRLFPEAISFPFLHTQRPLMGDTYTAMWARLSHTQTEDSNANWPALYTRTEHASWTCVPTMSYLYLWWCRCTIFPLLPSHRRLRRIPEEISVVAFSGEVHVSRYYTTIVILHAVKEL